MTVTNINRYSDIELAEFKANIEKELAKSTKQLETLESQLADSGENKEDQGDYVDDAASQADLELIQTLANRQSKHILDLKNALQRVHNKSYGICIVTGELIDKRRLMAVPTTARCLAAKTNPPVEKKPFKPEVRPTTGAPKIISRVISKPSVAPKPSTPITEWEDDDDLEENMDIEMEEGFDFDSVSEEDLDD